ncbi:MAG: hypothetical protein KDB46_01510 [Solirubrobacterales bacterium]|nr:hypothetical protein [Solirubrobacterales bacterium]
MQEEPADKANAGAKSPLHDRVELFATILLAVAAVATAWSSYQSARWSGVQAIDFSNANAARVESTRASTEAGQLAQVDVITFTQWVDAYAAEDDKLADFYYERFRDEFKPAVKAWVALKPLKNPKAPPTPFAMPEYTLAASKQADRLTTKAEAAGADARESNQRSDNYVLAVVLFAAALFFAGISTKITSPRYKLWIICFGYVIFLGTLAWVATFPVTVSV